MKLKFAMIAFAIIFACSKAPDDGFNENAPVVIEDNCTSVKFGEVGPAWVNWNALKNKNVPVAGQIKGEGSLDMPTERLVGSKLRMKFDPNSVDSQIALRDERIKNIFLEMGLYPVVSYEGKVDFIESGEDIAPAEGQTADVRVVGSLSMAGQVMPLEVHASLKRENGLLSIRPSSRASMIDVKASGGLAANVADLIAAAGVASMERFVTLEDGELILERSCD